MVLRLAASPVMATVAATRPIVRRLETEVTVTATEQRPGAYTNKAAPTSFLGRCKKRRRRPGLSVATCCSELTIVAVFKEHGTPAATSFLVSIAASTFIFAPDTFLTHSEPVCFMASLDTLGFKVSHAEAKLKSFLLTTEPGPLANGGRKTARQLLAEARKAICSVLIGATATKALRRGIEFAAVEEHSVAAFTAGPTDITLATSDIFLSKVGVGYFVFLGWSDIKALPYGPPTPCTLSAAIAKPQVHFLLAWRPFLERTANNCRCKVSLVLVLGSV